MANYVPCAVPATLGANIKLSLPQHCTFWLHFSWVLEGLALVLGVAQVQTVDVVETAGTEVVLQRMDGRWGCQGAKGTAV